MISQTSFQHKIQHHVGRIRPSPHYHMRIVLTHPAFSVSTVKTPFCLLKSPCQQRYNFAFAKMAFISARCFEKSILPRCFLASSAFFLNASAASPVSIGIPLIANAIIQFSFLSAKVVIFLQ